MVDLNEIGRQAKAAAGVLAITPTEQKDKALLAIADALTDCEDAILEANQQDVADGREKGLSEALIDRLLLTSERLAGIARDVRSVVNLPDPVGREYDESVRGDGLKIRKRRTPLGVLGVIYESRPNVTVDVAALALKSGNAVILRGGKETVRSNKALTEAIQQGLSAADLPADCVQVIADPDRALVMGLLKLQDYVDMIIPRGGMGLHKFCRDNSTIPVMTGGLGICHLFVDDTADLDKAVNIIQNAKVQRPSVCNALDTLLVHQDAAAEFLPRVVERLAQDGVVFKADEQALGILDGVEKVEAAGEGDWDTEWMSLILGLKVVQDMEEAIAHIKAHSTDHSDGILTQTDEHADYFVNVVDSSAVFVNASTRFNDGGQFGLGAEVAISTQKLHARGPMGLEELTTYKWIVVGDGHIRG